MASAGSSVWKHPVRQVASRTKKKKNHMCLIGLEKNLIQLSGLDFFLASSRMELIKVICGISVCFHGYTVK